MVPMNLLTEGRTADYLMTGSWADKAVKEARRVGTVHETGLDRRHDGYTRIPTDAELRAHTGRGLRPHDLEQHDRGHRVAPAAADVGDVPLVSDASSDIFSRPIDVVAVRPDLRGRPEEPRTVGRHARHHPRGPARALAASRSPRCSTTPSRPRTARSTTRRPRSAIYVLGLVIKWLLDQGGLPAIATVNERKAGKLYAELDRTGFWRPTAETDEPEPDERHLPPGDRGAREGVRQGGDGGRASTASRAIARSAGCARRSTTRFPRPGVDALVDFMREFERRAG